MDNCLRTVREVGLHILHLRMDVGVSKKLDKDMPNLI